MEYTQAQGRPKMEENRRRVRVAMYIDPGTWEAIKLGAHIAKKPAGYVIDKWHQEREQNSKPAEPERFSSHRPTPRGGGGVRETQTRVVPDSQERRDVAAPVQTQTQTQTQTNDPIIDPETGEVVFDV